jgi:hypothetical protein
MTVDRTHELENDAERTRLRAIVGRLSDAELSRPMPGGWTVAAQLAHAATWDARAIHYIDTWGPDGQPTTYEEEDTDAINESAKPLCLALPPRTAAELALRIAEESDAKVRALSDAMLLKIEAIGGPPFNLSRAIHRREHLDDIERELGR